MSEKWNKRCGCNCPKDAHVTVWPRSWRDGYTDWKCTATIHDEDISWPCRCSFIEKSMATGISCKSCGHTVPLVEKVWAKYLYDGDLGEVLSEVVTKNCPYYCGGEHEPIDAAPFLIDVSQV